MPVRHGSFTFWNEVAGVETGSENRKGASNRGALSCGALSMFDNWEVEVLYSS
jgi:hypothetical protein